MQIIVNKTWMDFHQSSLKKIETIKCFIWPILLGKVFASSLYLMLCTHEFQDRALRDTFHQWVMRTRIKKRNKMSQLNLWKILRSNRL